MYMYERVNYSPPTWLPKELTQKDVQRIRLANLPTPLQRLDFSDALLPRELEAEMFVKRDDFTGSEMSGNKIRKLEFILADALERGCDTVVTIGGIQSNHCRATVAAANALGLETHVVLRTSRLAIEDDPGVDGNLLVSRMAKAHIHLVTKEEYGKYGQVELGRRVVEELKGKGKKPYLVVVGGSSALGTFGYVQFCEELAQQLEQGQRPFDRIVTACGSGGTVAGIALGLYANPALQGTTLDAVMVCDREAYFKEQIVEIYEELGLDNAQAMEVLDKTTRFLEGKGAGYSISREEELDSILTIASETSICLDPTYTGKALHYFLDHVRANPEEYRGEKVLFVHTGGLSSLYGNEALRRRVGGSYRRVFD